MAYLEHPRKRRTIALTQLLALASPLACTADGGSDDSDDAAADGVRRCAEDDGSIGLPPGFCATVFSDDIGAPRHIAVSPAGVVFVADADAGVVALLDADDDGEAEQRERFGDGGGNGIAWHDGYLYFAHDDRIERWAMTDGELTPSGDAELLVSGLPKDGDHTSKTIVLDDAGSMFVNIGSATNTCQVDNREPGSPGIDPCPELAIRAGIWRFRADLVGQSATDGERWATGMRNAVALALEPGSGALVAVQNGRDQLFDNFPELFDDAQDDRLPGEELMLVQQGHDYGWPYCYYDGARDQMMLAPEYGGDGTMVGDCAAVDGPDAAFPAHWAPLSIHFYRGEMYPERYSGGAFVAFHGSRFEPDATGDLPGYNVSFAPFAGGRPTGEYELFADEFAGDARPLPDAAEHRPVGLAEAADGSMYITDDQGGRVWRVYYDLRRTPP
jgi:glucose/arabinose dehydrogenase